MKLRAIRVRDVKGFSSVGKAIEGLGDGLNILAAENEFGKSTLFEALRVVLFEKHNRRNARIEALRPYDAKGGPTVEVDIETERGSFRLHKRFLSRATASVIDLATGQAIASGDDVQDWVSHVLGADKVDDGPTGLLWVEQGKSLNQPVATETSGALLSGLIEQTVSEVTGGARVRAVLSRANAQLMQMITEKNRQPKGRYRDALKARDDLTTTNAGYEARVQDAETTRGELTRQQSELAQLEDPQRAGDRQNALKAATEKWLSAQQMSARLESLDREIHLTEQALLTDGKTLKDLEQAQTQARSDIQEVGVLAKTINAHEETLKKHRQHYVASVAAEDKQKTDTRAAKAEREAVRRAEKERAAQARLQTATSKLKAAEAVSEAYAEAIKVGDAIALDRAALENIEKLRLVADRADARRTAGQAKVSVSYAQDAQNRVRIDGNVLGDNEERPVDGRLILDVETVGRITIDAGAGAEQARAERAAKAARDAFTQALSKFGVTSMAKARDALEKKTQAQAEAKTRQAELQRIAPEGVQKLKEDCAELSQLVAKAVDVDALSLGEDEAEAKLRVCEEALEVRRQERHDAENVVRSTEQVLSGLKAGEVRLQNQIETVRQRFGADDTWERQRLELSKVLASARKELTKKASERSKLQQQAAGLEGLEAEKVRLQEAAIIDGQQIVDLQHQTGALLGKLSEIDRDGVGEKLAESRGSLSRIEDVIAALESEKRALEMLIETLEKVEAEQQDQFFAPVMEELQPLLHQVMPESELKFGSNFAPDQIMRDGLVESFAHLSGGTREQIAVLTRLAFARLMARKGRRMPVILDDALVYSDDERIARMFEALALAANDIQLIVLTCRQKTFQELGGTKLRLSDWQS